MTYSIMAYNHSIHSATKMKPIDVINGHITDNNPFKQKSYIFSFRLVPSSVLLRSNIVLQDALREITDNVGLIPIKLGQTKIIHYKYTHI